MIINDVDWPSCTNYQVYTQGCEQVDILFAVILLIVIILGLIYGIWGLK